MSGVTVDGMVTGEMGTPSPITELWRVLSRHKLLFATVALSVMVVGGGIVTILPRTYSATATVVVPPQETDPLQPSQSGISAEEEDARTVTEAAMLSSRDVTGVVVRNLGIGLRPVPSHLTQLLCSLGVFCKPVVPPTLDQRIDGFLDNLLVLQEPHSRVVDVTVTDRDPLMAAQAANALVAAEQVKALAHDSGDLDRTVGWLDQRTAELRQKWLDAVRVANDFRVSHQLTAAGTMADGTGQGLSQAEVQQGATSLLDAQARLAAAAAQQDALRRGGAAAMVADPGVAALSAQLATAEAARAAASGQLGSNNPELLALNNQVASAQASLQSATGRALAAVSDRARAARTEVAQLEAGLRTLKGNAGEEAGPVAQLSTLEQEAASARVVYETFLTREKELADRAAILRPQVEFVSHAPVPTHPSSPKLMRLIPGVLFLALAAAGASAFLRDHLAAGFRDVARLRSTLRLPLLSMVPQVRGRRETVLRHVIDVPYGRASEAMRTVMAQIALTAGTGETSQTVLISSADMGEGKTTIALWLATLAAEGGPGVLLIDGDHRRGLVSSQFGSDGRAPGLTELLAGEVPLDQVLQTDVQTGVRFIAAGRATSRALGQAEIVRLERLLASLRGLFRLIVIDSPPLMGMSDALVYARLADQTVLVCRWRATSRTAVTTSLERLREAGARLSGVVLSRVNPREALMYGGEYGPRVPRAVPRLNAR